MDCAVFAFNMATTQCNDRPGGCTQQQFNLFAAAAYSQCFGFL